jgi:glycerate 2-kinase
MRDRTALSHLDVIFRAGLAGVDPHDLVAGHLALEGNLLVVRHGGQRLELNLTRFRRILVLGAGKAAAPMALALERILGERIEQGCVVVKYGHTAPLQRIRLLEAGHPVPDENGVAAAAAIKRLAEEADENTLVLLLISGGGSALLPAPLEYTLRGRVVRLSLADKQQTTRALLRCGAEITEINRIRKHLSALKGGRLLQCLAPARSLSLILSDVVGDDLGSIASGLTSSDPSTYADALGIVEKYGIAPELPDRVMQTLRAGAQGLLPETLEPGRPAEALCTNILLGNNARALSAAGEKARELGYDTLCLTSRITGEAREVPKVLAGVAADVSCSGFPVSRPGCVISGGEPTVTLRGTGTGGRNQELALAFLAAMARRPDTFQGVSFLAAATDGSDGPTDAAGAFACLDLLERATQAGLSLHDFLRDNDAYHFFEAVDGLYKTAPTRTNVCDVQIILVR